MSALHRVQIPSNPRNVVSYPSRPDAQNFTLVHNSTPSSSSLLAPHDAARLEAPDGVPATRRHEPTLSDFGTVGFGVGRLSRYPWTRRGAAPRPVASLWAAQFFRHRPRWRRVGFGTVIRPHVAGFAPPPISDCSAVRARTTRNRLPRPVTPKCGTMKISEKCITDVAKVRPGRDPPLRRPGAAPRRQLTPEESEGSPARPFG